MDTTKQLGKRIQTLRKQKGLTQSQLAEIISVEVVTVSRIENGTRFPVKENLENIAKALGVDIKDLFDFEESFTKADLTKDINRMVKSASVDDLKYIRKLLNFYFQSK